MKTNYKAKPEEMKLHTKKDKKARKCQKERKNGENQQSIVATMTPIVQRWGTWRPRQIAETNLIYLKNICSIVATMDLLWPQWRAEGSLENYKLSSRLSQLFIQKFRTLFSTLKVFKRRAVELSTERPFPLSLHKGKGNFLSKASTSIVCIILFL
jgi:hypothetical protein